MEEISNVEYEEFQRLKREKEISLLLKKMLVEASRREVDKMSLKSICESAKRRKADGVVVSPVNVAAAKRLLAGSGVKVCCVVGGTGESFPATKKSEAKRAARQGAREVRLLPCFSMLKSGYTGYVKREIKKVRKATKRQTLIVLLDDPALSLEEVLCGIRVSLEAKSDGVCIRGDLLLHAVEACGEKLRIDCPDVENAEQFRLFLRAGATRVLTKSPDSVAEELYQLMKE